MEPSASLRPDPEGLRRGLGHEGQGGLRQCVRMTMGS